MIQKDKLVGSHTRRGMPPKVVCRGLPRWKVAGLCIALLTVVFLALAIRTSSGAVGVYLSSSQRFGVGVNLQEGPIEDYDVSQLHAGWYVDWGARLDPPHPVGMEYVQMIRVSGGTYYPGLATLGAIVDDNLGSLWLIGNEPDCIWQDNSPPSEYAAVYHELYNFLKDRDPSAKIAIGGIVQPTPLRLEYLDMVLDVYQNLYGEMMPVDVWNIHNMILREASCAVYPGSCWGCEIPPGIEADHGMLYEIQDNDDIVIFQQQIVAFRQWMKEKGERDKPLIVSEYGVLMPGIYGFDYARVKAFMYASFDYLTTATDGSLGYPADGNRLVQRWAWYSLNDDDFEGWSSHHHLFNPQTKQITQLGIDYGSYTSQGRFAIISMDPISACVALTCTQTVEIKVEAGEGQVDTAEVHLEFDPIHLQVVDVTGGNEAGSPLTTVSQNVVNNETGRIDYTAQTPLGGAPATGGFTVARIQFTALAQTTATTIGFLASTELFRAGEPVLATRTDGEVAVGIFGDFNCDCIVDVVDIMRVANRWRCRCADECYDPCYDIDSDCDIDIVDIMLVVVHWEDSCEG